jgi:hypothetical protein
MEPSEAAACYVRGLHPDAIASFERHGYCVAPLLDGSELAALRASLDAIERQPPEHDPALKLVDAALAEILDVPRRAAFDGLVRHPKLLEMVTQLLGEPIAIAAGLMLAKPSSADWDIRWHQDTSVYASELPSGLPGELRGGIATFRPLDSTMGRCVLARIAVDPAGNDDGGLFVVPGTHHRLVWPDGASAYEGQEGVAVPQDPGSVLFLCPLLIHRSGRNDSRRSARRVIQLNYRPASLRLPAADWYAWPHPVPLTPADPAARRPPR